MDATTARAKAIFSQLGVRRVINGESWVTKLGGSIMPPEVLQAMSDAAGCFVDIVELHRKAGEVIAKHTQTEAGMVTAGCSAAQVLQAAACMTGTSEELIARLPDSTGMRNEVIIQRSHANHYDSSYRFAGAKLVEIGTADGATVDHLADAFSSRTAAVAYVWEKRHTGLALEETAAVAHERDVPVIVDAAAELPPVDNLSRLTKLGADMVAFSGGKGIRGPQGTGILTGRRDLINAAMANMLSFGRPKASIGRPMKVTKEEIVGLITALEMFADGAHEAEWANWLAKSDTIVRAVAHIPGLVAEVEESPTRQGPVAVIRLAEDWGRPTVPEVVEELRNGEPSIWIQGRPEDRELAVVPVNIQDGEDTVVGRRLREVLEVWR